MTATAKPQSPMGDAVAFAGWSLASLLAGAVAGNRLDDLAKQTASALPGLTQAPSPLDALANAALVIGFGLIAFLIVYRFAIPRFREIFLHTVARAVRQDDDAARPYRAVVLTLSRLEPDRLEQAKQLAAWVEERIAAGASKSELLEAFCDKRKEVAGAANMLGWQQTLRTIKFHAPRLKVLEFVLSPQAAAQFPLFERIAAPLLRIGVVMRPAPHVVVNPGAAVELTDYNKVTERLVRAGEEAMALARCGHDDLCFDITAGQKIWSAAATIVTLNTAAAFGYVNTRADGDEDKIVIFKAQISR